MLLAIDIGNTNITMGVFRGEILMGNFRMTTQIPRTSDDSVYLSVNYYGAPDLNQRILKMLLSHRLYRILCIRLQAALKNISARSRSLLAPGSRPA